MRSHNRFWTLSIALILLFPSPSPGQVGEPAPEPGPYSLPAEKSGNDPFAPKRRTLIRHYPLVGEVAVPEQLSTSMPDMKAAIRHAAEQLRDAEGDEEKSTAEKNLRDLLTKYFDEDMRRREHELKEMEDRLRNLQEQLARRKEKSEDIIDLQIRVLVDQANGLGFFSDAPSPEFAPEAGRGMPGYGFGRMPVTANTPQAQPPTTYTRAPAATRPVAEPLVGEPAASATPAATAQPAREPRATRESR